MYLGGNRLEIIETLFTAKKCRLFTQYYERVYTLADGMTHNQGWWKTQMRTRFKLRPQGSGHQKMSPFYLPNPAEAKD